MDRLEGKLGAIQARSPDELPMFLEKDTTDRFVGSFKARSTDGRVYFGDGMAYDLKNWRIRFAFGPENASGLMTGTAVLTSHLGWSNEAVSTEQWTCQGARNGSLKQ